MICHALHMAFQFFKSIFSQSYLQNLYVRTDLITQLEIIKAKRLIVKDRKLSKGNNWTQTGIFHMSYNEIIRGCLNKIRHVLTVHEINVCFENVQLQFPVFFDGFKNIVWEIVKLILSS